MNHCSTSFSSLCFGYNRFGLSRDIKDSLKKMGCSNISYKSIYDNDKFIDAWVDKASKFDIKSYDKIVFSYMEYLIAMLIMFIRFSM